MKKTAIIYILLFALAILLFNLLSLKTGFTDSPEYINVAKALAGLINTNVFIMHSIVYSVFLSTFLKVIPSLLTLKLLNALWLILDAILIYKITNNKNALLLWLFSPIAYYMSIWISPMLPISFLFLLCYHYLKKYESTDNLGNLAVSALSLGLILSLREQMFAIAAIFLLVFFLNKQFKIIIYYLLLILPTLSIRFLVDYYYFDIPFYTILTFTGSLFLGGLEGGSFILSEWFLFPFIIAPLSFMIYKLDREKYKRELVFLVIFILTTIPIGQLRFFMAIAPFTILLLAKVMKAKHLIINSLIAIVLISVLTYPYFLRNTEENRVIQDLNAIKNEINPAVAIVTNGGAYSFPALPTSYWNEPGPRYIWSRDLQLFLVNATEYRSIQIESRPRLQADKIVSIHFSSDSNRDNLLEADFLASNPFIILNKDEHIYNPSAGILTILWRGELDIKDVRLVKCYQELCVYRKS